MKNLIYILAFVLFACGGNSTPAKEEPEVPDKYKKGDIVCVVEFNVKGIVQYRNWTFGSGEAVYSVMFNNKYDELYNLNIYESQLTECH